LKTKYKRHKEICELLIVNRLSLSKQTFEERQRLIGFAIVVWLIYEESLKEVKIQ